MFDELRELLIAPLDFSKLKLHDLCLVVHIFLLFPDFSDFATTIVYCALHARSLVEETL